MLNNKDHYLAILSLCIISSLLPDLGVLLGGPGTIVYLSHRAIANSLIFAPIFALLPVFFFYKTFKIIGFRKLYIISLWAYLVHIFFDLITPYGTNLFYPFSKKVFSLDIMHSFDPIFMAISVIFISVIIVRLKKKKNLNNKIKVIFFAIYLVYFGITIAMKMQAKNDFVSYLQNSNTNFEFVNTIPRTFWRWRGIAKQGDNTVVLVYENNKLNDYSFKSVKN